MKKSKQTKKLKKQIKALESYLDSESIEVLAWSQTARELLEDIAWYKYELNSIELKKEMEKK